MITFNDGEYLYTFDDHVLERFHPVDGSERRMHISHIEYARIVERDAGHFYEFQGTQDQIFGGRILPEWREGAEAFVAAVNNAIVEAKDQLEM